VVLGQDHLFDLLFHLGTLDLAPFSLRSGHASWMEQVVAISTRQSDRLLIDRHCD